MIESLEQYRSAEKKLQELLESFGSAGDLVDGNKMTGGGGDWQNVGARVKELKDDMTSYRSTHPEEFQSQ